MKHATLSGPRISGPKRDKTPKGKKKNPQYLRILQRYNDKIKLYQEQIEDAKKSLKIEENKEVPETPVITHFKEVIKTAQEEIKKARNGYRTFRSKLHQNTARKIRRNNAEMK